MHCMNWGFSQSAGAVVCFRTDTTAVCFYSAAYLTHCHLHGASDLVRDLLFRSVALFCFPGSNGLDVS